MIVKSFIKPIKRSYCVIFSKFVWLVFNFCLFDSLSIKTYRSFSMYFMTWLDNMDYVTS